MKNIMFRKTTILLFSLLFAFQAFAQEKPKSTLFIYFNDGGIKAFPPEYVKDVNLDLRSFVRLTLINDSIVSYFKSNIDSVSYYGPELPSFTSFKFNNKFNENLTIDAAAAEIADTMVIPVTAIGKRLTPSFQVSDDNARVYIGSVEQQSKVSRPRFDKDITYTVSLPGDSIFDMEKLSDEEWSEEVWSEEVWYEPIEEISLRPDMLSTNQPSNYPEIEDLDKMLDNPQIYKVARVPSLPPTDTWTFFEMFFDGKDAPDDLVATNGFNLALVFSSSINGAQFEGAVGSTLCIDEVEVFYEK